MGPLSNSEGVSVNIKWGASEIKMAATGLCALIIATGLAVGIGVGVAEGIGLGLYNVITITK